MVALVTALNDEKKKDGTPQRKKYKITDEHMDQRMAYETNMDVTDKQIEKQDKLISTSKSIRPPHNPYI
jgi:hypothetical protein